MTSILEILGITEEDLSSEENRRKTLEYWPIEFINKDDMAGSGFYYNGLKNTDRVRCFCCKIELHNWQIGNDAFSEHKKWSSTCEHLVELKKKFKYPRYRLRRDRLTSFENWPKNAHVQPEGLSEAGFYYTGVRDECVCYHCGVKLGNWGIGDNAWENHVKFRPNCKHIVLTKGTEYIDIIQTKIGIKNSKKGDEEEIIDSLIKVLVQNSDEDRYRCGICMDDQREIGLIPCGHTFCSKCSNDMKTCPICRKVVKDKLKLYF